MSFVVGRGVVERGGQQTAERVSGDRQERPALIILDRTIERTHASVGDGQPHNMPWQWRRCSWHVVHNAACCRRKWGGWGGPTALQG